MRGRSGEAMIGAGEDVIGLWAGFAANSLTPVNAAFEDKLGRFGSGKSTVK